MPVVLTVAGVVIAQVARFEVTIVQIVTFIAGAVMTALAYVVNRIITGYDNERIEYRAKLDAMQKTVEEMRRDISVLKDRADRSR